MRRELVLLAGAAIAAVAVVSVVRTVGTDEGEPAPPTTAAAPEPARPPEAKVEPAETTPVEAPETDTADAKRLDAEVARLTAELAAHEATVARLEADLAARTAELDRAGATLAERDAALTKLREEIAARDAELAEMRGQIGTLRRQLEVQRTRWAFDQVLAVYKAEGEPGAPRVEDVRAEDAKLDEILAARKAPAEPPTAPTSREQELSQVHFESGSARLTPGGRTHAAVTAVVLADMPIERIRVVGYADRVGDQGRNDQLAMARAQAVVDFLVETGLPSDLIDVVGMGETELPMPTDDGVAEPLNRCVAIVAVRRPG